MRTHLQKINKRNHKKKLTKNTLKTSLKINNIKTNEKDITSLNVSTPTYIMNMCLRANVKVYYKLLISKLKTFL